MIFQGKRILIFQQRNWGLGIGHFLALKLQAEGCLLAAVTLKRDVHQFVLEQKDVKYELLINIDEIIAAPHEYLAGQKYSLAEICEALGVDTLWPYIMSLRYFAKSYKDKYYFGFKKNVEDEVMTGYAAGIYHAIRRVFKEFKPDLILTPNFADLFHIMFYLYARKQAVAMLGVTDSKIEGMVLFSYDFNDSAGPFHERVQELNENQAESANRERARKYIAEFRQEFKQVHFAKPKEKTFRQKIRRHLAPFYHILMWYLKRTPNYLRSVGVYVDYKPPRIILRDYFAHLKNERFAEKFKYHPLDKIDKFVYFPLQFQPEEVIDVKAPFFANQIETARQVAMSLPQDYTLAVKEHPSMIGLRPASYLEKVARTPNVKLIDYRLPSEVILKKADLVVSPSGTILVEAAFYNKAVIQLGDGGLTLRLPNVFHHTHPRTLSAKIKEVLAKDFHNLEYERRLENYVAAVYDTGFKFDYWSAWVHGKKEGLHLLWQIYRKEIENNLERK